MTQTKLNFLH
jgi:hypothetical protein